MIKTGAAEYTSRMQLVEAHLGYLLIAISAIAVVLGLAATVLAARLMLAMDKAANDPVFRSSHRTRRPRTRTGPARVYLVS